MTSERLARQLDAVAADSETWPTWKKREVGMGTKYDLRTVADGASDAWDSAPESHRPILRDCANALCQAAEESEQLQAKLGGEVLNFYVVRSAEGKYYRRDGYRTDARGWVDSLSKARVYARIGPARAIVTRYAQNYPGYELPKIIRLVASEAEVIDDSSRAENARICRKRKVAARKAIEKAQALAEAQLQYDLAHTNLERLTAQIEKRRSQ